ncbi:unnamed protein product [Discosporangium mesarthrocarpum]
MLEDHTFQRPFRMDYPSFKFLYGLLRPKMNRDVEIVNLRNGAVAGEWSLASTLRWLSGGSYFELVDGPTIACSTAYSVLHRTLEAINSCPDLVIVWLDDVRLDHVAAGFRERSRQGIMDRCVGAADGLSIRNHKPRVKEQSASARFYSGHKKGFGLNLQTIWDARYIFTAGCISCPGSTNDRTAWNMSNAKSKVMLPDGYYIIGDSAYPPSYRLLVFALTKMQSTSSTHKEG